MRKKRKSKIGWIEDCSYCYDYETGKMIKKQRRRDDALKYFYFATDVTPDRVVLKLPLITSRKSFWQKRHSKKVKITIEYI
jgi:hypothetical protein